MSEPINATPPEPIVKPIMHQVWTSVAFLHWPVSPALIHPYLPDGLSVDTFNDTGWISITPFVVSELRTPGIPPIPGVSRFLECNVRTYVMDARGRRGVWFFALYASNPIDVLGARLGFSLPYRYACMHYALGETTKAYVVGDAIIVAKPSQPLVPSDLDLFLTARWRLFTQRKGRLMSLSISHQPWPLIQADVPVCDIAPLVPSTFPIPKHPLAHAAPRVDVSFGPLHDVRTVR